MASEFSHKPSGVGDQVSHRTPFCVSRSHRTRSWFTEHLKLVLTYYNDLSFLLWAAPVTDLTIRALEPSWVSARALTVPSPFPLPRAQGSASWMSAPSCWGRSGCGRRPNIPPRWYFLPLSAQSVVVPSAIGTWWPKRCCSKGVPQAGQVL